jgi:hypothetical protein
MNAHSGRRANSEVRGKAHHSFHFLPAIPRDYLARRRMFQNISNVIMIVLLSLIIAGVIIYTSDPNSFTFLRH